MASEGKSWVLLAAGSKGWEDYSVQANVCHAYQLVHRHGVPDQQIVVMIYDDIAYNQHGENDSIFIYLSDHGNKGIFHFPNSTLYAHDLISTVKTMSRRRRFSKVPLFYFINISVCRKRVKLSVTSFGEQFSYLEKHVSEDALKAGVTEMPCCYGDKSMLKLMLSEFLGDATDSVSEVVHTSQLTNLQACDVVETTAVPLIVQKKRIKNEQEPEKRQTLQRQYDDLIKKRKMMDEALQKIAELLNVTGALSEKQEVTRTYELKLVAEHFRKNLFNWEEEPANVCHIYQLMHRNGIPDEQIVVMMYDDIANNPRMYQLKTFYLYCVEIQLLSDRHQEQEKSYKGCRSNERCYGYFYDSHLKTWLSNVFTAYWLRHTENVNLKKTSFGDQFSYLQKKVSEDMRREGLSQTPCNYGDMKRTVMDEVMQMIVKYSDAPGALSEQREVTRMYELKVVAEHFKANLFNWEKEPHRITAVVEQTGFRLKGTPSKIKTPD
ncbi:Legumain [Bagarius yarrelli]|uniref:Legumain n=1 Tax=Bagarius yarrelli TaxID=175774 RepID=A0A556V9P7_BAGYA|nr:Legumain [Bagarius yarrelli]